MRKLLVVAALALSACGGVPRESVELASELRRAPPGANLGMADRNFDCAVADRACVTLWLYRGAACAVLAEGPGRPDPSSPERRDCAVEAFRRAQSLMPSDATQDERLETSVRLADALERRRDRVSGERRRAENDAILAAVAPLRGGPAAGYADHYAAGVALNRVQAGDIAAEARCATLIEARDAAARATEAPGLPPLGPRLSQRRAAIASQLAANTPRCA